MSTTGYAYALFNQSLEINERIGNVQGKAMILRRLGDLAEQQGEYTKAISYEIWQNSRVNTLKRYPICNQL